MPGDFGVVGAAKLTEGGDGVLLPYLECDNWPARHIFNERQILRQHALVNIIEFLDDRAGQVEELHG